MEGMGTKAFAIAPYADWDAKPGAAAPFFYSGKAPGQ